MRVLYIEDSKATIRTVRHAVERVGGSLIAVERGAKVRPLLTERFDLVLCDYILPDMRGDAIVAMLRSVWPSVPIVVITGSGLNGEQEKCRAAGCTEFLIKPVDPVDLDALLQRYLAPDGLVGNDG